MNKQESIGIGAGSVSILAIFVVLCLTTLSALSLVSARADYVLAQKTAQSAEEYYMADAVAEQELADLMGHVKQGFGWEEYALQEGFQVFQQNNTVMVSFSVPINDNKELYAEVELGVDDSGVVNGQWNRTVWQARIINEYEIKDPMEVF